MESWSKDCIFRGIRSAIVIYLIGTNFLMKNREKGFVSVFKVLVIDSVWDWTVSSLSDKNYMNERFYFTKDLLFFILVIILQRFFGIVYSATEYL